VADLPGVRVYPRQGYNPIDAENRNDFFDSLFHAAAVVGINTSAMIEAAIVGRPVCSLLAEEFAGTQEGTIHFHHLLPENGGFLRIAATLDDHVRQLADCLRHPETTRAETERFVGSFIRPHGLDHPATPIFVDVVERLAASAPPAPRREAAWLLLLRPVVAAVAAITLLVDGARDPDTPARARKQLGALRKQLASVLRRGRKQLAMFGKRWKRFRKEVL